MLCEYLIDRQFWVLLRVMTHCIWFSCCNCDVIAFMAGCILLLAIHYVFLIERDNATLWLHILALVCLSDVIAAGDRLCVSDGRRQIRYWIAILPLECVSGVTASCIAPLCVSDFRCAKSSGHCQELWLTALRQLMSGGGSVTAKSYGHCQELWPTALRQLMSGGGSVTVKSYGLCEELWQTALRQLMSGFVTAKSYGHCQELWPTALWQLMSGKDTVTAKS